MKRFFVATVLIVSTFQLSAAPVMRFTRSTADSPASLFYKFGGSGVDGWHTVSGIENLGGTNREFTNLTIPEGTTLTVNQVFAYIAVQGVCTIGGTIDADGQGPPGSPQAVSNSDSQFGITGLNAESNYGAAPVGSCVTGAGGGGNIPGGGAGSRGGGNSFFNIDRNGKATPLQKIIGLSGGSSGNEDGKTLTDGFSQLVAFPGAAGGLGFDVSHSVNGGNGGGVIYIECGTLVFTGNLTANGGNGVNGTTGSTSVGGGGGGGGAILVRARHILTKSGAVAVNGGLAGQSGSSTPPGGNGARGFADIVTLQ